jgi:hypothetical protein
VILEVREVSKLKNKVFSLSPSILSITLATAFAYNEHDFDQQLWRTKGSGYGPTAMEIASIGTHLANVEFKGSQEIFIDFPGRPKNVLENICFGNELCENSIANFMHDSEPLVNIPGYFGIRTPAMYLIMGSSGLFLLHSLFYNRTRRSKYLKELRNKFSSYLEEHDLDTSVNKIINDHVSHYKKRFTPHRLVRDFVYRYGRRHKVNSKINDRDSKNNNS